MNCKGCGKDKPIAEMFVRGGKPIRTCRICRALQMGGGKSVARLADKVVAKTKRVKSDKAPRAVAVPSLAIEPSFGLDAAIDDGYLKIIQVDSDGKPDTLMLSKADVRGIVQTFGPWAAAA
jgi:hypothetical protein